MKPLKRMSLKDIVIDKLHKHIAEHGLQPGDRFLNEKEIIQLSGVSRTVVREALKALESVGVLRIKPGDGIYVSESSIHDLVNQFSFRWSRDRSRMLELLETRKMLELAALELIINRLNAGEITVSLNELDENTERMAKAIEQKQSIMDMDIEFHRHLFRLTGNQTFYELSEVITQYFDEIRERRTKRAYGDTLQEHIQMVRLIKLKDLEGAKTLMIKHLRPLEELIKEDGCVID